MQKISDMDSQVLALDTQVFNDHDMELSSALFDAHKALDNAFRLLVDRTTADLTSLVKTGRDLVAAIDSLKA